MKKSVKIACVTTLSILLVCCFAIVAVACDGTAAPSGISAWEYQGSTIGGNEDGSAQTDTDTDSITDDAQSLISSLVDTAAEKTTTYDLSTATAIVLTGADVTRINVSSDTTYVVSGNLRDGQLLFVNDGSEDYSIHIVLNGVTISSTTSAPIVVFSGLNATITLAEGTTNTLTDGTTHTLFYTKKGKIATVADDDKVNGCLYAQNNLTINGNGTLIVNANYDNGIVSKGVLKILCGTISVTDTADGTGIKGKNSVVIKGGKVTVVSEIGDGIKTDYEPSNAADVVDTLGFVYIETASVTVNAKDNGICADTLLQIESGTVNVTANGGAPSTLTETSSNSADGKGLKAGAIECEDGSEITTVSLYKLIVNGGSVNVNSNDDALHSGGYLYVNGGTLVISSGDDGIHAEEYLKISGGTVNITKCYEGIEAAQIAITGGDVNLVSTDDGINAANGDYATSYDFKLVISDGNVNVNAQGDGMDSNGSITISGGTIYIDGPTGNDNSSLDSENGVFVSGGTLVAVGSNGMVETPASNSTQCAICYGCQSAIAANSTITLKNALGEDVLTFTTAKQSQSVVMSSSDIVTGGAYTLYVNGTLVQPISVSSTITTIGTTTAGGGAPSAPSGGGWGIRH